jgi:hypothetical protein
MLKTGRFLDLQNQRPGPVSSFLSKKTQNDVGKIMEYQSGWWFQPTPSEKYEFVSWDDDSQYMESHKIHVPNHQTGILIIDYHY